MSESRQRSHETGTPPTGRKGAVERSGSRAVDRRDRARVIAMTLLAVAVGVFAVLNRDEVEVHWLVTTANTPLIVVIAVSFAAGILTDRLLRHRKRRRQRASGESS